MKISEVTRRNIVDEMRISGILWNGRLEELDFLKRIFSFDCMPSHDDRFKNMEEDYYQHRIRNFDWDDDWIFFDSRINLFKCEDKLFLNFICETIHPIVRNNEIEISLLLNIFNQHLEKDGYEIFIINKISGNPVYSSRLITKTIIFENATNINSDFVKKQIDKCNLKLKESDYDGAVSTSRSLVEGILGEIYEKSTGRKLTESGDLLQDFKRIKNLLNLTEEKHSHDGIKNIIRSLSGIIQNIDTLSNKMGDRHRPLFSPSKHHAKLVVDCAITIADFLMSSMEYQNNRKNFFVKRLLDVLDSDKRNYDKQKLQEDKEIKEILKLSDKYLRQISKNEIIESFEVKSFRQSDIYFSALRILFEELDANDIISIYIQSQTNDQMLGWKIFEQELKLYKPDLLEYSLKEIFS